MLCRNRYGRWQQRASRRFSRLQRLMHASSTKPANHSLLFSKDQLCSISAACCAVGQGSGTVVGPDCMFVSNRSRCASHQHSVLCIHDGALCSVYLVDDVEVIACSCRVFVQVLNGVLLFTVASDLQARATTWAACVHPLSFVPQPFSVMVQTTQQAT